MKLILSSCDFRNDKARNTIIENLNKPIEECKLLFNLEGKNRLVF